MDESSLATMKYQDIRQRAKELGINLNTSVKPKKEQLLEAIKAHYESQQQQQEEELNNKKSARRSTRTLVVSIEKKAEKKKKTTNKNLDEAEDPEKEEKKKKKRTKTRKIDTEVNLNQVEQIEIGDGKSDVPQTSPILKERKKKVKKIQKEETTTETSETKSSKQKKTKKPKTNESDSVAPSLTEAKIKRKKKKIEKVNESPAPTLISNKELEEEEEVQNKSDEIKLKLDDESNEPNYISEQQNKNIIDSSLITNDEDSNSATTEQREQELNITKDINNKTFEVTENTEQQHLHSSDGVNRLIVSASIHPLQIEDPYGYETSQTNNAVSSVSCASFYKHSNQKEDQIEQETTTIKQQHVDENNVIVKPKQGGARIVRPKQFINVKETEKNVVTSSDNIVLNVNEETNGAKKLVEIIQREAGPRIVKPAFAIEAESKAQPKRTTIDNESNKTKKLKNVTTAAPPPVVAAKTNKQTTPTAKKSVVPNFKSIHEKESNKFESVVEHAERLKNRHKQLASNVINASNKQSSTNNIESNLDAGKIETTTSTLVTKPINKTSKITTPIMTRSKPTITTPKVGSTSLAVVSNPTHIPRLQKKTGVLLDEQQQQQPKTPSPTENKLISQTKTPMSALRQKVNPVSALQNSSRKPLLAKTGFNFENQNLESNINFSTGGCVFGANAPTNNLLATSSFNRRKSYDLNASLARPLNYNPHVGKLKPVEISKKSIYVETIGKKPLTEKQNQMLKQTNNLNETTVLKNVSNDKRKSLIMQRHQFKLNNKITSVMNSPANALNRTITLEHGDGDTVIDSLSSKRILEKNLQNAKRKELRQTKADAPRTLKSVDMNV